jgi:hypothetical protein
LEVVIRELCPFLLQLAFGDVPVAFDFKCGHKYFFICYTQAFGIRSQLK